MALEPLVVLGLVRAEIVEHDVKFAIRISADDLVHEIEELAATPASFVHRRDFAGGHFQSGKQRGCAVAFVVVAVTAQGAAIGQFEIALRPFERLDGGFLVHAQNNRVLGWCKVKPDDIGGFRSKLRVSAFAPGLAPGQIDPSGTQVAPDVLFVHIFQFLGDQRRCPTSKTSRRRAVQNGENALSRFLAVFGLGPDRGRSSRPARPSRA